MQVCDEETGMKALNNSQAELASKQIPAADLTADLIPAVRENAWPAIIAFSKEEIRSRRQ